MQIIFIKQMLALYFRTPLSLSLFGLSAERLPRLWTEKVGARRMQARERVPQITSQHSLLNT